MLALNYVFLISITGARAIYHQWDVWHGSKNLQKKLNQVHHLGVFENANMILTFNSLLSLVALIQSIINHAMI